MNRFSRAVRQSLGRDLAAASVAVLQVNLGLRCNLLCRHCHVEGSPQRPEVMTWATMEKVLGLANALPGCQVDLTGGAPELNPDFRRFVSALRSAGHPVQVRTNLTVMLEPGQGDLPEFCRHQQVQLVASLPCYLEGNVAAQRGVQTYEKSVSALQRLNRLGYGQTPELTLGLVYNPGGPFLPPRAGAPRRGLSPRTCLPFWRRLHPIADHHQHADRALHGRSRPPGPRGTISEPPRGILQSRHP